MRIYRLSLFILIAVFVVSGAGFAQFGQSEKIVSAKLSLSPAKIKPGGTFKATVKVDIKDGYHIGANHKDALSKAELKLTGPKGITFSNYKYPAAKFVSLSFAPGQKIPVYEGKVTITAVGRAAGNIKPGNIKISGTLVTQGCKDDQCFPPETTKLSASATVVAGSKAAAAAGTLNVASSGGQAAGGASSGLFGVLAGKAFVFQIVLLFGIGILIAFTPCIYPMIPVTVGYFSGQGQVQAGGRSRGVFTLAAAYVIGLALTYSILGVVAASTGGVFGAAMQKPPVLIGIAAVLVALALSMFGLFEIRPPAFIESRSSGRAGAVGALVMGAIFGVVAAPCAGPVVIGLMLHVAKLGNPALGFLMFFALALGLGTPLFALGVFSAKLPVPGMWMMAVKKLAGFLLIGAAIYFLMPILPEPLKQYLIPALVLIAGVYFAFFEKSIQANRTILSLSKASCVAAAVVAVAMAWPGNGTAQSAGLAFEPYSVERFHSAADEGRPVMMEFGAKWCGVCREMEHGPFRDAALIEAADKFVRLKVDGTNPRDSLVNYRLREHSIKGFPTIILFDSSGEEVDRIVGYASAKELIARLGAVE